MHSFSEYAIRYLHGHTLSALTIDEMICMLIFMKIFHFLLLTHTYTSVGLTIAPSTTSNTVHETHTRTWSLYKMYGKAKQSNAKSKKKK